ncbi:MAG: AAA family ATPase [Terriglobales bacterium]
MQAIPQVLSHCRNELQKAIVGQQEFIDEVLVTLLCGGHALVEGVPGLAKTLVVKVLALILQIEFQRVQCTSDLMPADLLGTNVLNMATSTFDLHRGPIFTQLLLVDEINRMPPRTQASLLECMEERQVTMDGVRHPLSEFFTVLATQNPVEFEGTYPLPEAQLDRFLLKIKVDYPSAEEEVRVLDAHQKGLDTHNLDQLGIVPLPESALAEARDELRNVKVEPALLQYITNVARTTRTWPALALGASPRAAISLLLVAKGKAVLEDRDYIVPDDVKAAALPALRHRMLLKPEAELEGINTDRVIRDVLASVEVPK